jgi:hypothetical protein
VTKEEKPRFVLAAEELAQQRGVEWETVLATDRERSSKSSYPGPDCLAPDELEKLFSNGASLESARAAHVANCRGCTALLATAGVDPAELQRILDHVTAAPAKREGAGKSGLEALGKTARVGSLFLAAGFATVLAARHFRQK